ncbi:MAG: PIN domain-containing protein [Bryobacteraceae bacterium]|nr:PIN domain-containing protein [Bryobacteraceae bacterium]
MVTLVDTGPLVSLLSRGTAAHDWMAGQWKRLEPPLLTCEAVLTEAAFLLQREKVDSDPVFDLLDRGVVRVALSIGSEHASVRALMRRYRNVPMSLADACLVRLSELHLRSRVLTLDSDFRIYRRFGNRAIPLLTPV